MSRVVLQPSFSGEEEGEYSQAGGLLVLPGDGSLELGDESHGDGVWLVEKVVRVE